MRTFIAVLILCAGASCQFTPENEYSTVPVTNNPHHIQDSNRNGVLSTSGIRQ